MNTIRRGLKRKDRDGDGEEYQAGLNQFQVCHSYLKVPNFDILN